MMDNPYQNPQQGQSYQQPNPYQQQNSYNPQSAYQQNPYQTNVKNTSTVSIGDWIITLILMMIPLVGFIMLFVWAFGGNTPESKSNWAKAMLIFYVIGFVLAILLWGAIAAFIGSMF